MSTDESRPTTYRTFDEVQETLSPAEQRFERIRRTAGLFAGPVIGIAVYFACSPLDEPAQRLAGVLAWVAVYWICEAIPIPVTAMLAMALVIALGIASSDDVFGAFGNSTIFVFIGGFILAESMSKHGLDRRFAFGILSLPGVAVSTTRRVEVGGQGQLGGDRGDDDDARGVARTVPVLAAVFGASFGFMLPVSTPPNAIVYGTGMVPITRMLRSGIVFDVIGIVIIVTGVTFMANLLGLA